MKMQAKKVKESKSGLSRWEKRRSFRKSQPSQSSPIVGDYVGLCILIDFPDCPATISPKEVDRFLNQKGYSNFDNNGSVFDYFLEVSGGKLRYNNIVTQSYYKALKNKGLWEMPDRTLKKRITMGG